MKHGATQRSAPDRKESTNVCEAKQAEEWGQFVRKSDLDGHPARVPQIGRDDERNWGPIRRR